MPAKLCLPNAEIVRRWVDDPTATSRSLAVAYGCASTTISAILRTCLSAEQIAAVKNAKIARSTALRPDQKTPEHREHMRRINLLVCPVARIVRLAKGAKNSAVLRKGKPLSDDHKRKLAQVRTGMRSGEKSNLWRGGTAKASWRGPGWTVARRDARERDGNTCQLCGAAENIGRWKNMDVHHIRSFYDFATPAEANVLSNLICLCRTCHKKVECGATCPTPKAALEGVPLVAVNPKYTSQTCPACLHVERANRRTRDRFECVRCGHAGPADTTAAVNISRLGGRHAAERRAA